MQLLVPGCSYCGAYFGWQHLKAQRKRLSGTYRGCGFGARNPGIRQWTSGYTQPIHSPYGPFLAYFLAEDDDRSLSARVDVDDGAAALAASPAHPPARHATRATLTREAGAVTRKRSTRIGSETSRNVGKTGCLRLPARPEIVSQLPLNVFPGPFLLV